jgi:hypothetical protein
LLSIKIFYQPLKILIVPATKIWNKVTLPNLNNPLNFRPKLPIIVSGRWVSNYQKYSIFESTEITTKN